MAANRSYKFAGIYELRPTTVEDLDLARRWTMRDPAHAGILPPSFWLQQTDGRDSFLLSDDQGPVFFFKMHLESRTAVRIFIQFPPGGSIHFRRASEKRTAKGLIAGMDWLEKMLAPNGVTEIFFDSASETLISFCVKRLGFVEDGEYLKRHLAA